MQKNEIDPKDLVLKPHFVFDYQMVLLTSGDFSVRKFNAMTIGWGSIGTMWNRPFALIAVRPHRYTFEFLEKSPDYTLTVFPDQYRTALQYLGSHSGRSVNKIVETGLTPIASSQVLSPSYEEAELSIECKKIYYTDLDPAHFVDPDIERHYPTHDYHRIYFGEILTVWGTSSYLAA